MSAQSNRPEKLRAALRLMGNPYASLSLIDDEEVQTEPTFEQKRAYFRELENPHAYDSIFGNTEDNLWHAALSREKNNFATDLEKTLDDVIGLYKPYVARKEWLRLMDYRPTFLEKACQTQEMAEQTMRRLQQLKFSLASDEKVEYNRAPAARIIAELEKLLA